MMAVTVLGVASSIGFVATLVAAITAGVVAGIMTHNATSDAHRMATESYARQWYCSKCGTKFEHPSERPRTDDGDSRGEEPPIGGARSTGQRASGDAEQSSGSRADEPRRPSSSRWRAYAERIVTPVQRAKSETERDLRGLLDIADRADATGLFSPIAPWPLDLGLVSRLASLGYLAWHADRDVFAITSVGLQRVANVRA
jgi:hypothetical protein